MNNAIAKIFRERQNLSRKNYEASHLWPIPLKKLTGF